MKQSKGHDKVIIYYIVYWKPLFYRCIEKFFIQFFLLAFCLHWLARTEITNYKYSFCLVFFPLHKTTQKSNHLGRINAPYKLFHCTIVFNKFKIVLSLKKGIFNFDICRSHLIWLCLLLIKIQTLLPTYSLNTHNIKHIRNIHSSLSHILYIVFKNTIHTSCILYPRGVLVV